MDSEAAKRTGAAVPADVGPRGSGASTEEAPAT